MLCLWEDSESDASNSAAPPTHKPNKADFVLSRCCYLHDDVNESVVLRAAPSTSFKTQQEVRTRLQWQRSQQPHDVLVTDLQVYWVIDAVKPQVDTHGHIRSESQGATLDY